MLPKTFPPWSTIYDHYREWNLSGKWQEILDSLNEKSREIAGKKKSRHML